MKTAITEGHDLLIRDTGAIVDALPIDPGRVRSHRIFKSAEVTVIGIAIDAGAEMREHVAAVPILVQGLDGEAVLEVGGARHPLRPGTVVHVEARVPHAVIATEPTRFLLLLLGPR